MMPDVEIREIGPKAFQGMLDIDDGALQFHRLRFTRIQVLRDGTYIKPKNEEHFHGSMIAVRALLVEITVHDLIRPVVTAYDLPQAIQEVLR